MFIVRKNNTKSFSRAKVVEELNEGNIDELFTNDSEVFRLVPVSKDEALEVQKRKEIEDLQRQQMEIQKRLSELGGKQDNLDNLTNPVPETEVLRPSNPVQFLSEADKNNAQPEFGSNNISNKSESVQVGESKRLSKDKEVDSTVTRTKTVYPTNPETNKEYTSQEFFKTYCEFKDLAEQKEQVMSVDSSGSGFTVLLTEDIKLAPTHRGIPLRKRFM